MEEKIVLCKITLQGDLIISGNAVPAALHGKELPGTHTGGWGFCQTLLMM